MDDSTTGDNIGHKWKSATNCSAVSGHPAGAWQIYEHGADLHGFLQPAYELYNALWGVKLYNALWGVNQPASINTLSGIRFDNLEALRRMAAELGRPAAEAAYWTTQRDAVVNHQALKPPPLMRSFCSDALHTMGSWFNDSWVQRVGTYNGANKSCWQNGSVSLLLAPTSAQADACDVSTMAARGRAGATTCATLLRRTRSSNAAARASAAEHQHPRRGRQRRLGRRLPATHAT